MNNMKKVLIIKMSRIITLIFVLNLFSTSVYAEFDRSKKIEVDGIYYHFDADNLEAEVTGLPQSSYYGDVKIPSSVEYKNKTYTVRNIGRLAFQECRLSSVDLPNTIRVIKDYAFASTKTEVGMKDLEIVFPEGVTTIESGAFDEGFVVKITLPSTVTELGSGAFSDAKCLEHVNIPGNMNITEIPYFSFGRCSRLKSIVIPEKVEKIGEKAFLSCFSLSSVTLSKNLKEIGASAFWGCDGLTDIYCLSDVVPDIQKDTFEGVKKGKVRLHVPASMLSKYKAHKIWGKFNIVP